MISPTPTITVSACLLRDMAEGKDVLARSKEWGKKYSQVRVLKEKMESDLREHMGPEAVADDRTKARALTVAVEMLPHFRN